MKSLSSPRIARGLLLLACLAAGTAQAESVIFGSRLIEVPSPAGYEPLSKRAPRFVEISAGYLPAGNRLVEAYASTADAARLEAGEAVDIKQYFQLQTLRSVDGTPVPADAFDQIATSVETEIDSLVKNVDGQALSSQGNTAAQQATGTNPEVEIGGMKSLGKFRREPWGVFFTTRAVVTVAGKPVPTTGSAAIVLANQQLMYLYAYSYAEPDAPNGKAWTERAVSDWADAVYAANGGTVADEATAVAAAVAAADESGAEPSTAAAAGTGGKKRPNVAVFIALGAAFIGLAVVFIGVMQRKRKA